jgi:hypothetical protein
VSKQPTLVLARCPICAGRPEVRLEETSQSAAQWLGQRFYASVTCSGKHDEGRVEHDLLVWRREASALEAANSAAAAWNDWVTRGDRETPEVIAWTELGLHLPD